MQVNKNEIFFYLRVSKLTCKDKSRSVATLSTIVDSDGWYFISKWHWFWIYLAPTLLLQAFPVGNKSENQCNTNLIKDYPDFQPNANHIIRKLQTNEHLTNEETVKSINNIVKPDKETSFKGSIDLIESVKKRKKSSCLKTRGDSQS